MRRFGIVFFFAFAAILFCFFGCGKHRLDSGKFTGNVYHNKYFGLTVTLPVDVTIAPRAKESGDGNNASTPKTLNLFTAYLYPDEKEVVYNPNIICMAEHVDKEHGVVTGRDYHLHNRKIIESMSAPVTFSKDVISQPLGGKAFDYMRVAIPLAGFSVNQQLYARKIGDYILVFAISYTNSDEKNKLEGILKTIRFD
ncbi:MAG: hypothetical protein B5M56_02495 [Desulfococcus sp. 4484_241]|nr:MAG: hypothetical protein B5M56_02495 [Desulfococcus sp. 4484_241]